MLQVLGLKVDLLARQAVEQRLRHYLEAKSSTSHLIVTANAEMYYQAAKDPRLKKVINNAALCVPDSVGILRALRRQGLRGGELYPGVELAEWLLRQGRRVYILGARDRALARLTAPNIVGKQHGFFAPEEEPQILAEINRLQPDILLAALGAGRQELWLAKHQKRLKVRVMLGVGGAIDVLSGYKRRAPYIWRKCRLEWFYRLLREPWRLRRQLNLLRFWLAVRRERK